MFKLNLSPFFAPPDDGKGSAIEDKELSREDMIKFMGEDDDNEKEKPLKLEDEKEEEKEGKRKEKEEKEEKEEDEDEEEKEQEEDLEDLEDLDEPDDEKLELMTPARRKDILAKYPNVFKDFPYLERAYYREQQFTELLPTIEDAKTAVEKSSVLDSFEADLLNGNTEKIFTGLKQADRESFNKLIDNLMPTLYKTDTDAYYHVIGNVVKDTIASMAREAKRLGEAGEPLQSAALLLNQFVFGTSDFVPPAQLSKGKKDEQEDKISERERAFNQKQYENARTSLNTRVDNVLKSTIETNIDPKSSMTDYVRKTAIRDALENLTELMSKDSRLKVVIDKLWDNAFNAEFSQESMNRIKSAYLSKAKTLLPEVIKRARNEALKGLGKRVSEPDEGERSSERKRGHAPVGQSASSTSSSGKSYKQQAKEIPRGMKSIDYLMKD